MNDAERFIQFCESEFGSSIMNREAAYVKQHVAPEDRILDVGCGIGSLEDRFTSYDILGVDQSEAIVWAARERTAAQFLRGDARALPIAPGTVDSVVFVATLSFIVDLDTALSGAIRVINSDGTFVALVLNIRTRPDTPPA